MRDLHDEVVDMPRGLSLSRFKSHVRSSVSFPSICVESTPPPWTDLIGPTAVVQYNSCSSLARRHGGGQAIEPQHCKYLLEDASRDVWPMLDIAHGVLVPSRWELPRRSRPGPEPEGHVLH